MDLDFSEMLTQSTNFLFKNTTSMVFVLKILLKRKGYQTVNVYDSLESSCINLSYDVVFAGSRLLFYVNILHPALDLPENIT